MLIVKNHKNKIDLQKQNLLSNNSYQGKTNANKALNKLY